RVNCPRTWHCPYSFHLFPSSYLLFFFFSSRRRHTRSLRDWSSDVCSSDLDMGAGQVEIFAEQMDEEGSVLDIGRDGLAVHRQFRSEERRVGKECRSRWSPDE